MSLWSNTDANTSAPKFAVASGLGISANGFALHANTTANVIKTGLTVGVLGVSAAEKANTTGEAAKVGHAGWVLRTSGQGARSGRVHYETIVAMGSMTNGAEDDAVLPQ